MVDLLAIPRRVDRILRGIESLGRLDESLVALRSFDASLVRLAALDENIARLAASVEVLPELAASAESLPRLTEHAAELRHIVGFLETLQPTVDQLTEAAAGLQTAVGPIGRIAGRLPGSRERV